MEIGIGVSLEKDPSRAAKEALIFARTDIHTQKIDLAILFSSVDLASPGLLKSISSTLPGVPLIGSSGAAIITNRGVFKHCLAIMLLSFSEGVYFNAAHVKDIKHKTGLAAGAELGERLLYGSENMRRALTLILSDAFIEESSNLISGLQSRLGRSFPFVGGSTSDNLNFLNTHLYYNQEMFNDGCVGILWGGKFNFGLGIKHGWKPLGKPHTVTAVQGTLVTKIDDKPAAQLYADYLGCSLSKLIKEYKQISLLYPIGLNLPGEDEYLLRNILSVDTTGALHFQGNVPQGSLVRLMISTKETCLAATQQAIDEAKRSFGGLGAETKKNPAKQAVLVFSSISRYLLLKRDAHKELDMIKANFKDTTPIIGLYTYGELAPLMAANYRGQVYFHNQTISILTLGG